MTKEDRAFKNFEAALAAFLVEHQPWPYSDVDRHRDEATDVAWLVAKKYAYQLWGEVRPQP